MTVCSAVAVAGREKSIMHPSATYRPHMPPLISLPALLMALAACLCANVEITETVTGGF